MDVLRGSNSKQAPRVLVHPGRGIHFFRACRERLRRSRSRRPTPTPRAYDSRGLVHLKRGSFKPGSILRTALFLLHLVTWPTTPAILTIHFAHRRDIDAIRTISIKRRRCSNHTEVPVKALAISLEPVSKSFEENNEAGK